MNRYFLSFLLYLRGSRRLRQLVPAHGLDSGVWAGVPSGSPHVRVPRWSPSLDLSTVRPWMSVLLDVHTPSASDLRSSGAQHCCQASATHVGRRRWQWEQRTETGMCSGSGRCAGGSQILPLLTLRPRFQKPQQGHVRRHSVESRGNSPPRQETLGLIPTRPATDGSLCPHSYVQTKPPRWWWQESSAW